MFWLYACATPPPIIAPSPEPGPGPSATWPDGLREQLVASWRSAGHPPRTRHLLPDGAPRYVNRLVAETSPYLRQHAHNPVDWRPWGPEALAEARARDLPIFLSVGYATCHWCHVMEDESFEDVEIAGVLNAHFIPVKVDREERPDVDALYMAAVQLATGRGGWPMTVITTPGAEPFFAATYIPARDGDRGMRTGLLTLLRRLSTTWASDTSAAQSHARRLADAMSRVLAAPPIGAALPEPGLLTQVGESWLARRDPEHGGLKGEPKFPSHLPIRVLLRAWHSSGDERMRELATETLQAMAHSGMRDQLGGGFHRYSTDSAWRVPHFEIMLYDQALLAGDYLDGWRATGEPAFAAVVREVLTAALRDLRLPTGAFGSALDADSLGPHGEREEGLSYTWTLEELVEVLGDGDGARAAALWGVTPEGNLDGRSVLHRPASDGTPSEQERLRTLLLEARSRRPQPLFDDKAIAGWNGLMARALAEASVVLAEPAWATAAAETLDAVLTHQRRDGRLSRTWHGEARHSATSDDVAYLAAASVSTFEATGDPRWIDVARSLCAELEAHYPSPEGLWHQTADDAPELLVRATPTRDGAVPAAVSIHVDTLLRLASLTGDDAYRARADRALAALEGVLRERPDSAPHALRAVARRHGRGLQVVLVVPDGADPGPLLDVWRSRYVPDGVLVRTRPNDATLAERVPLVMGKDAHGGRATGYVCERGSCRRPTSDPQAFAAELDALIGADQ